MRGRFSPKGMTEVQEMQERGVRSAVDLRSDTVTQPTEEMRRAMLAAEVGDDFYGEDPTVRRLESRAAELLGHKAGLLVPSGTMANQIAIHVHTRPGEEVICEARAHVYNLENGMTAAFSGCQFRPIMLSSGRLTWGAVEPELRLGPRAGQASTGGVGLLAPRTGLVVAENTHNLAGGAVSAPAIGRDLCRELHRLEIPAHLDGARIFNAAVALGVPASELAAPFDSAMFCLSKGLGAPVGSVLVGSEAFIARARQVRQMMGGGMRQAGVLAAAGLVAIEKGRARLQEDHDLARYLAQQCATIAGVSCEPAQPETNIVIVNVSGTEFDAFHVHARLLERNVLTGILDRMHLRLVTHADVDRTRCDEAIFALRAVIERE